MLLANQIKEIFINRSDEGKIKMKKETNKKNGSFKKDQ